MAAESCSRLAIRNSDDLLFGIAPHPVVLRNGLSIGGGLVHPELNFTLSAVEISDANMPEVRRQYAEIMDSVCARAADLHIPALILEFELLPPLTVFPQWGADLTRVLRGRLDRLQDEHGIKVGLRVTPNDIRDFERPPRMRTGEHVQKMFASFQACGLAGADLLAIESTGGKELHDQALVECDLPLSVFALAILGGRDMAWLWDRIVDVAHQTGSVPSGDSACAFGNTAMTLAERHELPKVWAATVRVMTVARSLVAFEHGALGPAKDCAYEAPYLKAITGCPISLEGAEAACAHLSPVGNVARAAADLWSNESVQNVQLLSAPAPTVSLEQLAYATRLMNVALSDGALAARQLRNWFVRSDAFLDPQAYVLRPEAVVELAAEIAQADTVYRRTRRAAVQTLAMLRRHSSVLGLDPNELRWLDRLSWAADTLPQDEGEFIAAMLGKIDPSKVRLDDYGLEIRASSVTVR